MLNKTKKIALSLTVPTLALALPVAAFAQELVPSQIRPINDIIAVVRNAIRFILLVAFVLAFIFLLIGGIRWIPAGGDEKAVSGARGMITAALIGLVIVLVSYALIVLVENFFNVSIISGPVVIPSVTDAP